MKGKIYIFLTNVGWNVFLAGSSVAKLLDRVTITILPGQKGEILLKKEKDAEIL